LQVLNNTFFKKLFCYISKARYALWQSKTLVSDFSYFSPGRTCSEQDTASEYENSKMSSDSLSHLVGDDSSPTPRSDKSDDFPFWLIFHFRSGSELPVLMNMVEK